MASYEEDSTIANILVDAAKAIIQFDKSLDILSHVDRGRQMLGMRIPSWVCIMIIEMCVALIQRAKSLEQQVPESNGE